MRAGASAEQLYDLERQVRALAEEVDAARTIIPILRKALDDIASWGEGPEVCGAFDEPGSAQTARDALVAAGFGKETV